jgi:hypothetical protein
MLLYTSSYAVVMVYTRTYYIPTYVCTNNFYRLNMCVISSVMELELVYFTRAQTIYKLIIKYRIWGSHSGSYERRCLLRRVVRITSMFRTENQPTASKLVSCLAAVLRNVHSHTDCTVLCSKFQNTLRSLTSHRRTSHTDKQCALSQLLTHASNININLFT